MSYVFGGDNGSDGTLAGMGLDVSGVTAQNGSGDSGFTLPQTQDTATPNMRGDVTLNNGVPDNATNPVRSDGITVSGVLQSASATADSLTNVFGKIYSLYNQGQNIQYSAKIADQQQQLNFAGQQASIDLQKTQQAAALKIGQLNAQKAVADAQAKATSGAAGFVKAPGFQLTAGVVAAAFVGFLLLKKEKIV